MENLVFGFERLGIDKQWEIFIKYLKLENIEYKIIKDKYVIEDDEIEIYFEDNKICLIYSGPYFALRTKLFINKNEKDKIIKIVEEINKEKPNEGILYYAEDEFVHLFVVMIIENNEDVKNKIKKYLNDMIILKSNYMKEVNENN